MESTNETGNVYFVLQALNTCGVWVDLHVFNNQIDACEHLLNIQHFGYPYSRHRIVERFVSEKVLQEIEPHPIFRR